MESSLFKRADLCNEFNDILQSQEVKHILQLREDASIEDDDIQKRCCELLQSRQRDVEYLSSLDLHKVIVKHVRARCKMAQAAEENVESWVNLDPASAELIGLEEEIACAIRAAWKVRTPSCREESKFTGELSLDNIDKFHHGLESQIGYPPTNADFLSSMKLEHEKESFLDSRNRVVDPKIEWNIVMQSDALSIGDSGVMVAYEPIVGRACTEPLEFYMKKAMQIFEEAKAKHDALNAAEVAALRLWTGPMHEKYAEALRNPQNPNGPYVTTLHAINSAITKLAKIWPLPVTRKVYRGYKNLRVQDLKKDLFNCVGGVEKRVLATSEDFNIAVDYSQDGAFILEIEVGQASRGADVSWVSQFPHEREILFNALSNVEFVCSPQQRIVHFKDKDTGNRTSGKLLVYQVRVSANLRSKTLEEFFSLRKDLHLNLVDVLAEEALLTISMRADNDSRGLIKRLCKECKKQCDAIRDEAVNADVKIFNDGTEEYIGLVRNVKLFKSRSETIIDLASRWFELRKANPAEVEGLLDWQLQALRDAFNDSKCERPQVTTLVLDKDLQVGSLFGAESLNLGDVHKSEIVCSVAKLLSLNPKLESLEMVVASATLWENVFNQLCPCRPSIRVNGFHLAQYAISTLQRLELRHLSDQMAAMIAPALLMHPPRTLTCLNLCGTPIACAGAESLGRAFTGLQRLKYLDLRSCQIADRGCTGIAQTLVALSELADLNLAHNNVHDHGFNILASTIRAHRLSQLQSVDMRFNTTQLPSMLCGARCVMKNHIVSKLLTTSPVGCVAWSAGGDQIASGSADNTITISDANTGEPLLTLKGHTGTVTSVAWRPRGDQIASGSRDGTIIIWDAKTGEQVSTLKGHTNWVTSVAWRPERPGHPGGDQIASGSIDRTVIIWDAKTGEQISTLKGHTDRVTSVAWRPGSPGHPGGDQIASGSDDGTIIIWDAKTGEQVSTLKGHTNTVRSVAWRPERPGHPGGDQIASGSQDDTIIIWDAKTGEQVSTLKGHTNTVTSVAWRPGSPGHPGGDQIASGSRDDTIIIWDAKTDEQISTLKGHTNWVTSVAWRRGDQIASASYDKTIIIWDAQTGKPLSVLRGHTNWVTSVAWRPGSPGGDQIVSGGYGAGRYPGDQSAPGEIIIWDAKTGDLVSTLKGHTAAVTSVAWRPGGDQIATGSYDGTIIIWDAKSGEQVSTLKGHTAVVMSVDWRPGIDQIVSSGFGSGGYDSPGEVIIWDANTGDKISELKGHSNIVTSVAWRPGGDQIATGSRDHTIIIWDLKTGEQLSTLKGHTNWVNSVAWRPGGDQIASGSYDNTIIIWDAKTGEPVSTLKGHTDAVISVDWRPGGDQIASVSKDKTIIIWDFDAERTYRSGHQCGLAPKGRPKRQRV